ncbi:MAG: SDR family NAD(P)-dependent oxidoreductase [Patescibacteria group bacterium]
MTQIKNILISGGSSGIGFAIAKQLIKENFNVGIISRENPKQWVKKPPIAWVIKSNYLKTNFLKFNQTIIKKWLKQNKYLNALILCANSYGNGARHNFSKTSLKEWQEIFQVNVNSQFQLIKLSLPYLSKKPNSLILGITSEVAFKSGEGRVAYASSKAASHNLLKNLAQELSNTNISIVELLPTNTVDTPGIRKRRSKSFDFSKYHSPDLFIKPSLSLINKKNIRFNGKYIKVGV